MLSEAKHLGLRRESVKPNNLRFFASPRMTAASPFVLRSGQYLVQISVVGIRALSAPPLPAQPVRERAKRFPQVSGGQLHLDECHRVDSMIRFRPRLGVNTVP